MTEETVEEFEALLKNMDALQASKLRKQFEKLRQSAMNQEAFRHARTVAELEASEKNRIDQI